jgi:SAM-dependent methyltransferase
MSKGAPGNDVLHWTSAAADWIKWVQRPDHDAFWAYRSAFEAFVGKGEGKGLEVGAGEGRISRCLGGLGYRMTLCEPVPELLAAAKAEVSGEAYANAPGHDLPFDDETFELCVLYNVLMDVEDLAGTLAEATRVLRSGGTLIVGIVHPFADLLLALRRTGEWDGYGSYFDSREFDAPTSDPSGLTMHFRGWSYPLDTYQNAMIASGVTITRVQEPRPDPDHPWCQGKNTRWLGLPLFLWIRSTKD